MPGLPPSLLSNDPTSVQHVLKDNFNNYVLGRFRFQIFQPFLGQGTDE
jgi:hypothetical protein